MAKFLTTSGISYEIERTLKGAQRTLVLISPYLKISDILLERLRDADRRGVEITIVYGKSELAHQEAEKLGRLGNLRLLYLGNLHAKCYFNESRAVVGSMNMYEFSEKNNREAGILITESDDRDAFEELLDEARSIVDNAEERGSQEKHGGAWSIRSGLGPVSHFGDDGYCIRCRRSVTLDPFRPLCNDCFDVWVQWGNDDFPEKYCHACGGDASTSRGRPLCRGCGDDFRVREF